MADIIRNRQIVADDWTLLRDADAPLPATGRLLLSLARWKAERDTLLARGDIGVWLAPEDDPAVLADDLPTLSLIAIDFPTFRDGRGYSTAYLLRTRYQFQGELRAIGDVLRDQLFYLQRVGFNAFAVRADRDLNDALQGLADFSEVYQPSADQPLPLFRRVPRGEEA
jgi:uncharacterized protein (DUF934 family)